MSTRRVFTSCTTAVRRPLCWSKLRVSVIRVPVKEKSPPCGGLGCGSYFNVETQARRLNHQPMVVMIVANGSEHQTAVYQDTESEPRTLALTSPRLLFARVRFPKRVHDALWHFIWQLRFGHEQDVTVHHWA